MKDIKAYIKVAEGQPCDITINNDFSAKEISLTDYMVGFVEYSENNYLRTIDGWVNLFLDIDSEEERYYTTSELLEIYLKEKGIII